ncbi:MAG: hypothetical protein ACREBU_06675 [Nitrososphaera sp.]
MANCPSLEVGDCVGFYVTAPTKKIVGFGMITSNFIDDKKIRNDEILFKRPIWKSRVTFKILHLLKKWQDGIDVPGNLILNTGRKRVKDETFALVLQKADKNWGNRGIFKLFFGQN